MSDTAARAAVEHAAREHYGRLLAHLVVAWRDPAAAEDALAGAFAQALARWPTAGVPGQPTAWLLAVARNDLRMALRHRRMADRRQDELAHHLESLCDADDPTLRALPDDRLLVLFACAHPAIDARVRTALMLNLVLGIDVARMAGAFLLPAATLAQRLVRAKRKVAAAGIAFELPAPVDLPARLHEVLEAIYAAYAYGRPLGTPVDAARAALADEALRLAALTADALPDEPEALGLLALLRYVEARRGAAFDDDGCFVPLARHDVARWDAAGIDAAEALLRRAAARGRPGPFQLEAAIQSAHCERRHGTPTAWPMIVAMYDVLLAHWPSTGAAVGAAVAEVECGRGSAALARLEAIAADRVVSYAPYWAARAHALEALHAPEAAAAWRHAAGLVASGPVRAHLLARAAGAVYE
jgi:RNA polymerase sigma-70 factor (ECF subfamily)